ncbi:MAG: hypothetical protein IJN93_05170 [Clostridia bacterium]|nr:hypothetical protein [Clostridia bacterium]
MKHLKRAITLLVFVLVFTLPFAASALDAGLKTETIPQDEKAEIINTVKFTERITYTPQAVKCFDVREDGKVLIGTGGGGTAIIVVYDSFGNYQDAFETEDPGSFKVMWSGNDIAYYSIRGQRLYKINDDGEIIDVVRVPSIAENSIYQNDILSATTRKVGDVTYTMTNESTLADRFASSFKKIIKTDASGTTVIYDASGNHRNNTVIKIIIFIAVSAFIITGAVIQIKRHCQNNTGDGSMR